MFKKNYALAMAAGITIFAAGFWAGGRDEVLFEAGQAVAAVAPATGVTKTVLFEAEHSWDGTPYGSYPAGNADIKIVKIVIPPNSRLGSHTHPMPNIAYVHTGALTVKSEVDGQERQLKQGDFLAEMVNKPHYGYTGDEGVELLLVYCGVTGQELSVSTK
ncbi:cupin domain-containing protein [Desulfovibrio sp. QI0430]